MEVYLGQIQPFAFNFAPSHWATCQGQIIPIGQNTGLFSLLGVNFGGNGTSNFGLPNLVGNVAIGTGQGSGLSSYVVGETGGTGSVTLGINEMPAHTHSLTASTAAGTLPTAAGNQLASGTGGGKGSGGSVSVKMYSTNVGKATTKLPPTAITQVGGNGAHTNMQPYLALNFCIALSGVFPPRP